MMSSSDSRAFPAMHSPVSSSSEGPHYLCQATVKQSRKKTEAREMAQQLGALALAGGPEFITPVIPAPKDPMYFP